MHRLPQMFKSPNPGPQTRSARWCINAMWFISAKARIAREAQSISQCVRMRAHTHRGRAVSCFSSSPRALFSCLFHQSVRLEGAEPSPSLRAWQLFVCLTLCKTPQVSFSADFVNVEWKHKLKNSIIISSHTKLKLIESKNFRGVDSCWLHVLFVG